jgi:hypothetical protein
MTSYVLLKFLELNQLPFCYDLVITGLAFSCKTNGKKVAVDYLKVLTLDLSENQKPGRQRLCKTQYKKWRRGRVSLILIPFMLRGSLGVVFFNSLGYDFNPCFTRR